MLKTWKNSYSFGIWDTAGQEKFSRISSIYCRGANAAILAYDITQYETFSELGNYLSLLKESNNNNDENNANQNGPFLVLVGTKSDLVVEDDSGKNEGSKRQVSFEEGKRFADSIKAAFYESSAKCDWNITQVFDTIGYHCLSSRLIEDASPSNSSHKKSPSNVTNDNCSTGDNRRTSTLSNTEAEKFIQNNSCFKCILQ